MRSEPLIVVEVDQPEGAQALLIGLGCSVTRDGRRILIARDNQFEPAQINAFLVQAGFAVSYLAMEHMTLESAFLNLTNAPTPEIEYVNQWHSFGFCMPKR